MPTAPPVLLERIDRLASCQGHWLLIRDGEPERDCSHQWHQSPEKHLQTCLTERWRGISLGFVPSYCGWSDYSNTGLVGKANFNVLTDPASTPDPHDGILTVGYGWNGEGVVLDVLRVPADVIETVEGLESYPLISEDEHSRLEIEAQDEAWQDWAESDWRKAIGKALQPYAPETADSYWGEELADRLTDAQLFDSFRQACDDTNTYWEADGYCGQWIDADRVAGSLDRETLAELTGLPLLDPEQNWRREPYPWPGADPSPLVESLPLL